MLPERHHFHFFLIQSDLSSGRGMFLRKYNSIKEIYSLSMLLEKLLKQRNVILPVIMNIFPMMFLLVELLRLIVDFFMFEWWKRGIDL
jgi:hypothetical protein